jgi:beta-galactosidase
VPHAGPDTRLHRAVRAHGAELRSLARVAGTRVEARTALVFDWSSWWAAEERAQPSDRLRVLPQVLAYYRALWRAGVAVDVVHPGGDLTGYDLVVAPQLYLVDDDDARNLRGVVERGGVLVLGPFSGVADRDGHVRTGRFPVPFADLVGASGEEFCPLPDDGVPVASAELGDFTGAVWGERLRLDGGEALATFAGADLDGCPAVVRHRAAGSPQGAGATGSSGTARTGETWYVATLPPRAVLDDVLARAVHAAGVTGVVPGASPLPDGVEAVRRGDVLFLLNTSPVAHELTLDGTHHDLLSGTDTTGTVRLEAEDAVALIERTS